MSTTGKISIQSTSMRESSLKRELSIIPPPSSLPSLDKAIIKKLNQNSDCLIPPRNTKVSKFWITMWLKSKQKYVKIFQSRISYFYFKIETTKGNCSVSIDGESSICVFDSDNSQYGNVQLFDRKEQEDQRPTNSAKALRQINTWIDWKGVWKSENRPAVVKKEYYCGLI